MVKRISVAGLLLSTLVGSASLAESGTQEEMGNSATFMSKNAEIGIMGVGLFEGWEDDPLQNTVPGVGVRAGYRFAPSWSVVGEVLAVFDAEYDLPGHDNVDVMDYIAGINYDVFPEQDLITPYISLGVGYRTVSDVDGRDAWNILPGLGVKFLLSDSVQFLVEAKARFNLEEDEKGALGTVALSYLFGGEEPEAAPVAVEPEAKPVEPEPVTAAVVTPPEPVDVDSDGDGVLDSADDCPDTKHGLKVDNQGCPITMDFVLNFETNSAKIDDSDKAKVNDFATFLNESPAYNVTLVGHADSRGTKAYNQKLSEKRANSVKAALTESGVDSGRIATEGKGETEPVADNATKEGQALNRHVEAKLSVE